MKVLVKEKIAQAGVDILKEHFEVEVCTDMTDEELSQKINEYDAFIVRSASQITADVLKDAKRVRMIGRAGVGVDNIDVKAATQKGIVVVNAPGSNSLSVAEHALGLLLAQVREIPNANASMHAGKWEKSKFKGVEITDKVLGIMGLGKIGVLVAQRAKGLGMEVIAYDPYVSPDRFRELGIEPAETPDDLYAAADFISVHLPKSAETMGMIGDEAFEKMKQGVRIINSARGGIVDEEALARALESGKVASAGLDVFSSEPVPEDFPLAKFDNVIMTPHLGASTTEGQDRAGIIVAEQIVAGLSGGVVTYAVNIPSVSKEAMEAIGPFLPLAETLGQLMSAVAEGPLSKVTVHYEGELAEHDTRLLTLAATKGLVASWVGRGGQLRERAFHSRRPRPPGVRSPGSPVAGLHQPHHPQDHRQTGRADRGRDGLRAEEPATAGQDLQARHRHRAVAAYGLLALRRRARHDRQDRHHHRGPRHQHRLHERRSEEGGRQSGDGARSGRFAAGGGAR